MSIFKEVKDHITAKEVAAGYGLVIAKNNMACCPFHDDRHPSMKIDTHYYCFACGAKGDAIGYVAQLYDMSQYNAARKIIEDFHLPVKITGTKRDIKSDLRFRKEKQEATYIRRTKERFAAWRWKEISKLSNINRQIDYIKEFYRDATPDEVFASEEFARALSTEPVISYWLDILCTGTEEEQQEYFLTNRKGAKLYDEQINESVASILARDRKDSGQ